MKATHKERVAAITEFETLLRYAVMRKTDMGMDTFPLSVNGIHEHDSCEPEKCAARRCMDAVSVLKEAVDKLNGLESR